jgi:hypothetical protein
MTATHNTDNLAGPGARRLVQRMGEAAANFLAALTPDQRRKGLFDFAEQEKRQSWFYTPIARDGLPLADMEREQQRLAHQLVATGLSRAGYVAASTIIGLETTLDAVEGWRYPGLGRDPGLYYISLFGRLDAREPWGWRFEGHHISLNYTIVDGQIVAPTPTFFGSNPAEAPLGSVGVLRPLGGVEDLARDLVHALTEAQRVEAVVAPVAPPDIFTANFPRIAPTLPIQAQQMVGLPLTARRVEQIEQQRSGLGFSQKHLEALYYTPTPKGLPATAMTAAQQEILSRLVGEYINRMPEELAEIELANFRQRSLDALHFAWAGGLERRQPHYYRLQGPRFLIEYDNTQNDANHIHSVWRDPEDDFGAQLLAQHYAHAH